MKILLLDDQYGKYLNEGLEKKYLEKGIEINFLIKDNVLNPNEYIVLVIIEKPSLIFLDHWFYSEDGWEESKGHLFVKELEERLKELEVEDYKPNIICISDNDPEELKRKYPSWNSKLIKEFTWNKSIEDLVYIINKFKF